MDGRTDAAQNSPKDKKMLKVLTMTAALAALTAGSAWACGGADGVTADAKVIQEATVQQVAAWVEKSEAVVYDANGRETFEAAHIPGAMNVDYAQIDVSQLPPEKDARLVFYCKNEMCGASKKAAQVVAAMGFTNLFVLKPGIDGWIAAGQKTESFTATAPAKTTKVKAEG